MAKLNLNLMLSNVAVNAVVVAKRMGQGSKLGAVTAPATLSSGWPATAGRDPNRQSRKELRLDLIERDALRDRAGRSAVSPNAGVVACHAVFETQGRTCGSKQRLAYPPAIAAVPFASDMRTTSAR